MSPDRLRSSGPLRRRVARSDLPKGLRWRIIARTPTILIDYLFELLLTLVALIAGLAQVLQIAPSNSINELLPNWVVNGYGAALLLGATTTGLGLITHRYGTLTAIGMRLLAMVCGVYGLAVLGSAGLHAGLTPFLMAITLALICGWRSFILASTYLLLSKEGTQPPSDRHD